MNDENEHDYFNCKLIREREKSIVVVLKHNGAEHSVPKSLCELRTTDSEGAPHLLTVEKWFADQEGMHE